MPQAGAHAIIGLYICRLFKSKRGFIPGVIMGSILPDIDTFAIAFSFLFLNINEPEIYFQRKATHSILFSLIIYFIFHLIGEIVSKSSIINWGKGLALGIILHILFDSFFFLYGIQPFWPITLEWNIWKYYIPPSYITNSLLAFEFLFFRIFAWILIQLSINCNSINNKWYLPWLIKFQKIQFLIFLFFSILIIFKISSFKIIFSIFYLPSLLITLISVWLMRDVLDMELVSKTKGL